MRVTFVKSKIFYLFLGFEYFTVNSFEQFCINYCNEKLQKFFNDKVLTFEQELYKREGLNIAEISFTDNNDIIELIESKNGIYDLLDEESKLPKPSYDRFTAEVFKHNQGHFRISYPRASKLKNHRSIRDDQGFLIRHFAGAVCYSTEQFIAKNNDALHGSLEVLVMESSNMLLKKLFSNTSTSKGKLSFISVGSKFKSQLSELMEKLERNGTSFVRCIKPNSSMVVKNFEGRLVLAQLQCSGTASILKIMETGFPSRIGFVQVYEMYKNYLPPELQKLDPRTFCEAMLYSLKLNYNDFKFGITKVFFRPGKFIEFDRIMKNDEENLKTIVFTVKKWLVRSRWMKVTHCAVCVIKIRNQLRYRKKCVLIVQKIVRGYLARRIHLPRYRGIIKIKDIGKNLNTILEIGIEVKEKKSELQQRIDGISCLIESSIKKIKINHNITPTEIDNLELDITRKVEKEINFLKEKLHKQRYAEEQERLQQMQRLIEAERNSKKEEEERVRKEEEIRRLKTEIELRRKEDEMKQKEQEIADRKAAWELQKLLEKEVEADVHYRQQLEQERKDHELAVRLAHESNGVVDEYSTFVRKPENNRSHTIVVGQEKFDLSKWKYSELRDTINTSCDIQLLEACRHEFHRRLKVYHAWKAKNRKRSVMEENERAPRSVIEEAAKSRSRSTKDITASGHRYFRIPFVRPSNNTSDNTKKGWWYAHFDGNYVARQMELHAEKPPILLVAGKDDMQICELDLEETGLTRKRGAEILEHEFNMMWERNGGKPYIKK